MMSSYIYVPDDGFTPSYNNNEAPLFYAPDPSWDQQLLFPVDSAEPVGHQERVTTPPSHAAPPLYHHPQHPSYMSPLPLSLPPDNSVAAPIQYHPHIPYSTEQQYYYPPQLLDMDSPYLPIMHSDQQQPQLQSFTAADLSYSMAPPALGFAAPMSSMAEQFDLSTLEQEVPVGHYMDQNQHLGNLPWNDPGVAYYGLAPTGGQQISIHDSSGSHSTGSPTDSSFEIASVGSSDSWSLTYNYSPTRIYPEAVNGSRTVCDPHDVLHLRSGSGSSDEEYMRVSLGDLSDCSAVASSPESEHRPEPAMPVPSPPNNRIRSIQPSPGRNASSRLVALKPSQGNNPSKISKAPNGRQRGESSRDNPEKKIGKRKGALNPKQREQARAIRKLGACIRCKFLKKSCSPGDPCDGCQPSHARLWNVPCTRIQIQEISNIFLKDWAIDYQHHITPATRLTNVINFGREESQLVVTHNFGPQLKIKVREVELHDEVGFMSIWIETIHSSPIEFECETPHLAIGYEGISDADLSAYLEQHLSYEVFDNFIENHFEGTEFLTKLLEVAHMYWMRTRDPFIGKALKLVLAYNLTQHITFADNIDGISHKGPDGLVDQQSKYAGRHIAPNMINFAVKEKMAHFWRKLMDEVLKDLQTLLSGVYNKDKLKNWAVIFLLTSLLLSVWELMMFDTYKRSPEDSQAGVQFSQLIESIPVQILVGLMGAVSQKLPVWGEWDTEQHGQTLDGNDAGCEVLTVMTAEVNRLSKFDSVDVVSQTESFTDSLSDGIGYLQSRPTKCYDPSDFDCFCNKFTSQLVIKA